MSAKTIDNNQKRLTHLIRKWFEEPPFKEHHDRYPKSPSYTDFLNDKMLIITAIRTGIPNSIFKQIQDQTPFTVNDWAEFLNISTKSLIRYEQANDYNFKPIHSEKIIELAEVTQAGLEVFGDMDKLKLWLNTPNYALGKLKPIELLSDSYGKELVLTELTRIKSWYFGLGMELYRLSREAFARDLSGKGAALKGGRWNSAGVELIYTAANRSLAMAEVAVHFTLATLPADYCMITLHVPDSISVHEVKSNKLPHDWSVFPHPSSTQQIGDQFVLANKYCLLKIPSVVTQGDFNYLINPKHHDFNQINIIRVERFPFDRRIFS